MRLTSTMVFRGLIAAVGTAVLAVTPGAAHAGWTRPPSHLGNLPPFSGGPFTAIDGRGASYVAWTTYRDDDAGPSTLRVRVRPAGGTWRPTEVPVRSDRSVVVFDVVATRGTLTVVWDQTDASDPGHPFYDAVLYASTRSREGLWTTTQLSQPGAVGADAAVNAGGALVVAWQTGDAVPASVRARIRSPRGSWGPEEVVSDQMGGKVEAGLDSAGFATVAAFHTDTSGACLDGCEVLTSRSDREGQWQPVPAVTAPAPSVGRIDDFSLAVGPGGEGALAWATSYPFDQQIALRGSGNNVWTDPHQLGDYSSTPSPAVAPDGGFTAVWSLSGATYSADLRRGQPLYGPWSAPQQLSTSADHTLWTAPDGTLVAVTGSTRLMRTPAGDWLPLPKPPAVGASAASWTLGDGGRIVAARATTASGEQPAGVRAASYSPDRPTFTRLRVPRTGRVGHRLTFKAEVGSWLSARVTWRLGSRRTTGLTAHHTFRGTGRHRVVVTVEDASGATTTTHRSVTIRRHS